MCCEHTLFSKEATHQLQRKANIQLVVEICAVFFGGGYNGICGLIGASTFVCQCCGPSSTTVIWGIVFNIIAVIGSITQLCVYAAVAHVFGVAVPAVAEALADPSTKGTAESEADAEAFMSIFSAFGLSITYIFILFAISTLFVMAFRIWVLLEAFEVYQQPAGETQRLLNTTPAEVAPPYRAPITVATPLDPTKAPHDSE
jgi:hypothetical protein